MIRLTAATACFVVTIECLRAAGVPMPTPVYNPPAWAHAVGALIFGYAGWTIAQRGPNR